MSTESNILDDIAAEYELSKELVHKIIWRYKEHIRAYLKDGYPIKLVGVGSLKLVTRKARKRVLNGVEYQVPEKKDVKFTSSVKLKFNIND